MEDKNKSLLSNIGLTLIGMVLAIVLIPILCSMGIAILVGAVGFTYFGIVIFVPLLVWGLLFLLWWI